MLAATLTLLGKELRESLRDRRTLMASLAFALAGPAMLVAMVYGLAGSNRAAEPGPVAICEGGALPDLLTEHLENIGYRFVEAAPICLLASQDDVARWATGRVLGVTVRADLGRDDARAKRLESDLKAFGRWLGQTRLMARGIAPRASAPLHVALQDTAAVPGSAGRIVVVLAIFFVLAPFFSSLASAIDATAGERERNTLEALVAQPVSPASVIAAKWLMAASMGLAGAALTIAAGFWALQASPLADAGLRLDLGMEAGLGAFVALTPLAFAVAAMQVWMGMEARSYKEGQNYLTLTAFLPAVAGIAGMRADTSAWDRLPVMAELRAVKLALQGAPVESMMEPVLIASALALLFLALATRRLRRVAMAA